MVGVAEAAPARPRSSLRQVVVASLIGTTIEWYDFFLYGTAAALVFGKLFFPKSDPLTGILQAFLTYALGFVARPIGGLVFGHFGDRIGRKRLLMASLVLMGVSSAAMGLLPGYAQIGVAAPVLLAGLRFVQGFAVGGEWGGAVLMAGEFGDAARRGTWAGWPQVGVPAGNLLAAGVMAAMAAMLSEADFLAWGWRIAFLLSALLVAVGWWVRSSLSESPQFEAAEARAAAAQELAPALQALMRRPGGIAIGAGLKLGENICYYVITTFSIAFLAEQVHARRQVGLNALLLGSLVEMLTLPLFSALSDRIGRRPVYAAGAIAMAAWIFVFFGLLKGDSTTAAFAIGVGLVIHGSMYGPQAAFISELFPTRYRYSGASIAYQVTSIFAGSLAPVIAVALLQQTRSTTPISIYVAVACAVSALAAILARETKGLSFAEIDTRGGG
ncbi:MAG TPA: MFS transporter [Caulobacteraceae bacterium]|nr:MFS transporter [Caulobacteraceae bacterium]